MIECSVCDSAQFLNIVHSHYKYTEDGLLEKFTERYECLSCGSTGEARADHNGIRVDGGVRDNRERPKLIE